ncbi:Aste57867_23666 [Aphanomyces stellatus]|uniref:Aste57867_23666 protein n=1 Tax=Aphanomyces stellatus TaxID=120398 RepID=A0A485LN99_9STRA|nr:hypothetical protein As57867_023594 [Aphanomyces stellatus]VFU00311.1 Aste57867_23666 [Aphanomyces stellatus]
MTGDDEELERGAELHLAQRHRVITPGVLLGKKLWEASLHSPGTTGAATLSFHTSGALPKESKIVLQFPDTGWRMPSEPNVNIKASAGRPAPRAKAIWHANTLEITTVDDEIEAGASVTVVVSGVSTPACATPSSDMIVTTYEKKVVRNTVPPSIRGGQIIDGPTKITIPTVAPGTITGPRRWSPFNCCPRAVADVYLDLKVSGAIPPLGASLSPSFSSRISSSFVDSGKILVELRPQDGWTMAATPRVSLRLRPEVSAMTPVKPIALSATWMVDQHVLEITLRPESAAIPMHALVQLTVAQVTNPCDERAPSVARVTTLVGPGVIDGPVKIDVARISDLRDCDFAAATNAFHAQEPKDGRLALTKATLAFATLSIALNEAELLARNIKVTSVEEPVDPPPPTTTTAKKSSAANVDAGPTTQLKDYVSLDDYLNFFTTVYTPAFKFGEELRTVAGRGQLERLKELVQCGCDANAKDGAGWTALHYAAEHGVLKAVNLLLDAKVDVNARDVAGWTPLMCAASNGHVSILSRLIEMGADVNVSSVEGRTALHWAATRAMDASVGFLLLAGAAFDAVDRSKWTPLHCAAIHANVGCAKLLLDHGADMTSMDALGHPAWEYWEAPAMTLLQAHLEKLETMGLMKKRVSAANVCTTHVFLCLVPSWVHVARHHPPQGCAARPYPNSSSTKHGITSYESFGFELNQSSCNPSVIPVAANPTSPNDGRHFPIPLAMDTALSTMSSVRATMRFRRRLDDAIDGTPLYALVMLGIVCILLLFAAIAWCRALKSTKVSVLDILRRRRASSVADTVIESPVLASPV